MTHLGKTSMVFLAMVCLFSMASHADQNEHQEGDTYKTVFPLTVVPYPCVSIQAKGARILLSHDDLTALSSSNAHDGESVDERMAFLTGQRARKLLSKTSSSLDGFGCAISTLSNTLEDKDALYVVAHLLEEGKATVIRDGKRTPEPRIIVDHFNSQLMGSENFLFVDGKVFFSLTEWVSYTDNKAVNGRAYGS